MGYLRSWLEKKKASIKRNQKSKHIFSIDIKVTKGDDRKELKTI